MVRYSTFDGCANTGARLLFLAASSAHFKREAGGSVVFVKNAQVYKKLSGVRLARIVFKESVCGLCGVSLSKGGVTSAELSSVAISPAHFKREAGGSIVFVKNAQVL